MRVQVAGRLLMSGRQALHLCVTEMFPQRREFSKNIWSGFNLSRKIDQIKNTTTLWMQHIRGSSADKVLLGKKRKFKRFVKWLGFSKKGDQKENYTSNRAWSPKIKYLNRINFISDGSLGIWCMQHISKTWRQQFVGYFHLFFQHHSVKVWEVRLLIAQSVPFLPKMWILPTQCSPSTYFVLQSIPHAGKSTFWGARVCFSAIFVSDMIWKAGYAVP